DGDALAADLAERARAVGVVTHQRRHVEGRRETGLAVVEQVVEALVGLLARAEAGELAHRPQPPAVHRGVDAARVRVGAGLPDRVRLGARARSGRQIGGRVELLDRLARERFEACVLGCLGQLLPWCRPCAHCHSCCQCYLAGVGAPGSQPWTSRSIWSSTQLSRRSSNFRAKSAPERNTASRSPLRSTAGPVALGASQREYRRVSPHSVKRSSLASTVWT